jgi:hypothetical protein
MINMQARGVLIYIVLSLKTSPPPPEGGANAYGAIYPGAPVKGGPKICKTRATKGVIKKILFGTFFI